jgi:hypothetical protein
VYLDAVYLVARQPHRDRVTHLVEESAEELERFHDLGEPQQQACEREYAVIDQEDDLMLRAAERLRA